MVAENLEREQTTTELQQTVDEFMEKTTSHKEAIETVISSLDQDDTAMVSKTADGTLWKFQYGSVEVFVQLSGESDDDLFAVWATVLNLPVKNETGLMKKLLEMNWMGTFETCFAIADNRVIALSQRTVAELSAGEISRAITLVASIADDNDETLKQEFDS
jgi:Putative bacterial sensory transduction regulator